MASRSGERTIQQITMACLHHDANANPAQNIGDIQNIATIYNKNRASVSYAMYTGAEFGFDLIPYHQIVAWDGSNKQTQDYKYKRHAAGDGAAYFNSTHNPKSANHAAIHICMSGYFHALYNQVPPEAMLDKVAQIIYDFEKEHNVNLKIIGHRETSQTYTACPGDIVMTPDRKYIVDIINRVNAKHAVDDALANWKNKIKPIETINVRSIKDTYLINFLTGERVKRYLANTYMEFSKVYDNKYYITDYSYNKNISNGFLLEDFVEKEDDWRIEAGLKENNLKLKAIGEAKLYNYNTGEVIKTYQEGTEIEVAYEGTEYYVTEYSYSKDTKNVLKKSEWQIWEEETTSEDTPEQDPVDSNEGNQSEDTSDTSGENNQPQDTTESPTDSDTISTGNSLQNLVKLIIEILKKIFSSIRNNS